jgi:uncharacterized damage-inducible protein DinB
MSRLEEIRDLYAFNRWANHAILDVVATLDEERYTRDLHSSFPSVQATLEHILQADWVWLQRWHGVSPGDMPAGMSGLGFPELRRQWGEVEGAQAAYLRELSAAELDQVLAYRNLAGESVALPLGHMLRHVVNHSTYHRGQVTTMLRQLGVTPPSTDLSRYYLAVAPRPEQPLQP